jgi:hypothetical protein
VKRWQELLDDATEWLEPEANPSGLVYGVLTIGVLIAAESSRRETYAAVIDASVLALVLYWLAHAYSRHFETRLARPRDHGLRWFLPALLQEASILKGASFPIVALLCAWLARAPLSTGVLVALWTAGIELLVVELLAGIRRKLPPRQIAMEVLLGAALGAGVLCIRVLLT